MKVKAVELFKIEGELLALKQREVLPIKVVYFINKNIKAIQTETKEYIDAEKMLLEKYADKKRLVPAELKEKLEEMKKELKTKEEKEKLEEQLKVDRYFPREETKEEFSKELESLQSVESNIEFFKIKLDDFGDTGVNPKGMDMLLEKELIIE